MEYVKKLAEEQIWNAGKIELYDFSRANLNQESREEAVAFVASECYGQEPKDRTKLYNKLLTEHCGGPASSLEFVRDWNDTSLNGCLRNNPNMRTFESTISDLMGPPFFTSACFNSVATFRLKIPVFIARQIMRHRSMAFSEQSRRYQDATKSPFEFWHPTDKDCGYNCNTDLYSELVCNGERTEVARCVLPQSLMTSMFVQGDIAAWTNYFNVRLDAKAQKEHRELAKVMYGMLRTNQPKLFERLHSYVDTSEEIVYNSSKIDTKEEAKNLAECRVKDFGHCRPDKWD